MFQSDGGGKATNSAILSESTADSDDGGGKASPPASTPVVRGIPPSPVLSASTHEERVSVRVLRSRTRSRKILTEEGRQDYAAQLLATALSDRMFATDRVPLAIVVVAQAQELLQSKSKKRKNAYSLPEGNVSMGEVLGV